MPLFVRRPAAVEVVEAEQVGAGAHTYPGQGLRPPRPGDWVVTNHANGDVQVLTNEEFQAQYDAAPIPSFLLASPGTAPQPMPTAPTATPPTPAPTAPAPVEETPPTTEPLPPEEAPPAPSTEEQLLLPETTPAPVPPPV